MDAPQIFLLIALIVISLIDLKSKELPSPLTTSIILILAIVNFENIQFGMLGFIFGWLLMEGFDEDYAFFSGVADLKAIVMLGLMVNSIGAFLLMVLLVVVVGVVYKISVILILKEKREIAFLPVFLIVYILMLVGGVL